MGCFLHFQVVELLVPFHLYVICDYLSRRQLWLYRRLAGRKCTPWTSTPIRAWGRGHPTTLTTNLCGPLGDRWARAGDKTMNDRRRRGEGGRMAAGVQLVFEDFSQYVTTLTPSGTMIAGHGVWTSLLKAWRDLDLHKSSHLFTKAVRYPAVLLQ